MKQLAFGDLEQEFERTRRMLERVPVEQDGFDLASGPSSRNAPGSRDALLRDFDERVTAVGAAFATMAADELMVDWTLRHGEHEMFTLQERGSSELRDQSLGPSSRPTERLPANARGSRAAEVRTDCGRFGDLTPDPSSYPRCNATISSA